MKRIGDFLSRKKSLPQQSMPSSSDMDEKTVVFVASKIISMEYGIRGKENVIPVGWRDKKLFLAFRSSLWMNEIWMEKESFCERINRELGDDFVCDIKVADTW